MDLGASHDQVFSDGQYAYVPGSGTFKVIDVSDPSNPVLAADLIDPALAPIGPWEGGRMRVATRAPSGLKALLLDLLQIAQHNEYNYSQC